MPRTICLTAAAFGCLFALAGCNFTLLPQATPTVQPVITTIEAPATATASPMPSPTLPEVESPTPTYTPAPPTATYTPSPTLGPYEHTIQQNETLGFIVQQYGYGDLSVAPGSIIAQVVAINGLVNADTLPGPGNVILIPRQTATPTPGNTATEAAAAATNAASSPVVTLPGNAPIADYVVQPNDTFIGVAQEYSTTIEVLAVLNPEVNIFGCNFEIVSGGPDCNPPLVIGQVLKVPAPTPTPTLSPTPSGSETPTPTPTYPAPMLVYPPQGAVAPPGVFSLQWVGVGILRDNEFYLVEVSDTTSGRVFRQITKDTSLALPEDMIPTSGQTHRIEWTVRIATPNEQGIYRAIGGQPEIRAFQWQSR